MNNYSEEFNWGSFLCRITGIGTSDPKTKILIILCIVNIEGHRDRYIGSLFRVDGPVPMILKSFFTKYFVLPMICLTTDMLRVNVPVI